MITLEVLRTGPLALVEDLGRPGLAHVGVTRSGAADRWSHRLANRLVANPDDRATVEVTFGGFTARVHGGNIDVAVTGADVDPTYRLGGRGASLKCSRKLVPVYSLRNRPRSRRMGKTSWVKSSRPPGR